MTLLMPHRCQLELPSMSMVPVQHLWTRIPISKSIDHLAEIMEAILFLKHSTCGVNAQPA